jgi:hypothetical protein
VPRNSSGVFSLTVAAFVPGGLIKSSDDNSLFSDIATALTQSLATTGVSSMTGPIKAATGTAGSPSYTFASDLTSGFFLQSAGVIGFGTGSTLGGTISSTGINLNSGLSFQVNGATPPIPASFITYSNIQNETASTILGNPTGSAAAPSEITLGGGMSFSGTTLVSTINPLLLPGYLSGLILSAAGSTGTFGIAAGAANDVASGGIMLLASAYTKTTASWVVGSGNGGLDTGSIANSTWYHVWLIERTDTAVVDVLFSLSATSPTMPASYTLKRRIGSMKTDASAHWLAFTQTYDDFVWATSIQDASGTAFTSSSRSTVTLGGVPTGVVVTALFRAIANIVGGGQAIFTSLLEADQAPSTTIEDINMGSGFPTIAQNLARLTNTSAQIGARANTSSSATYSIATYGWKDTRGK